MLVCHACVERRHARSSQPLYWHGLHNSVRDATVMRYEVLKTRFGFSMRFLNEIPKHIQERRAQQRIDLGKRLPTLWLFPSPTTSVDFQRCG